MSSPEKKRKKKPKNLSLPDDLLLNIVARISRLYYPTLSNVSKGFRSLVASPELYKFRSLLGHTESCLYVCFGYTYTNPTWFTLCRKPNQRKKKEYSNELDNLISSLSRNSGYVLVKVPITLSPRMIDSSLVAVGSNIYNIGGYRTIYHCESSSVWVMDCVSHTWREAPSLPVEPNPLSLSVSVSDGKIYVAGKFKKEDFYKDSFEVFDTRTEIWDPEPIPCREKNRGDIETRRDNYCEIDNLFFAFYNRVFKWYDAKERSWRDLKGLVELPDLSCGDRVKLANYGGKIAVLWEQSSDSISSFRIRRHGCYKKIWLAVIELERQSSEILGKVEWFDHVLTVPLSYCFPNVVAATV